MAWLCYGFEQENREEKGLVVVSVLDVYCAVIW